MWKYLNSKLKHAALIGTKRILWKNFLDILTVFIFPKMENYIIFFLGKRKAQVNRNSVLKRQLINQKTSNF